MADVYEIITARIISQLEAGVVPWRKPWNAGAHGWPQNLVSRKQYRGVNVFLLCCTDYELPYWLTFRQAKEFGGHVRKGEKSTPVVFWKWFQPKNGEVDPETGEIIRRPMLRYYNVFNVAQIEGIGQWIPEAGEQPEAGPFEPIAECQRIVDRMPNRPEIRHGTSGAFYSPADDTVRMPFPERFESAESYHTTLFHELTHSTGHESRLNRKGIAEVSRFGSETYSKEELVAEMGAAFLCGQAGIENRTIEQSAAYIAGWLKKLRNNKRLVVNAAASAQKAADFILDRTFDEPAE